MYELYSDWLWPYCVFKIANCLKSSPAKKRSQPPFLTLMMKEYIDKTADVQFLRTQLPTLVREMEFWEVRRSVEIIKVV